MWVYIIIAFVILYFVCRYAIKIRKQKIIRDLLQKSLTALNEAEVDYFIAYGTLLGYYRNNDVIWDDDDGDIVIKNIDINRVKSIGWNNYGLQLKSLNECNKEILNYKKQFEPGNNLTMFRLFYEDAFITRLDCYIDLYILDTEGLTCNIRTEEESCVKLKNEDIFPTTIVSFLNTSCKVPKNIPKILSELYGDYMTPKTKNFSRTICNKNEWKIKYCSNTI